MVSITGQFHKGQFTFDLNIVVIFQSRIFSWMPFVCGLAVLDWLQKPVSCVAGSYWLRPTEAPSEPAQAG